MCPLGNISEFSLDEAKKLSEVHEAILCGGVCPSTNLPSTILQPRVNLSKVTKVARI
jgi:hypothetical protein